jgi:hypothetical protein
MTTKSKKTTIPCDPRNFMLTAIEVGRKYNVDVLAAINHLKITQDMIEKRKISAKAMEGTLRRCFKSAAAFYDECLSSTDSAILECPELWSRRHIALFGAVDQDSAAEAKADVKEKLNKSKPATGQKVSVRRQVFEPIADSDDEEVAFRPKVSKAAAKSAAKTSKSMDTDDDEPILKSADKTKSPSTKACSDPHCTTGLPVVPLKNRHGDAVEYHACWQHWATEQAAYKAVEDDVLKKAKKVSKLSASAVDSTARVEEPSSHLRCTGKTVKGLRCECKVGTKDMGAGIGRRCHKHREGPTFTD